MLPATTRRPPTRSIRLVAIRPPQVWRELTLEQQHYVAYILAGLVRRIHQQPQPDSRSEPLEIPYIRKEQGEGR
jgi:hypothetical protein